MEKSMMDLNFWMLANVPFRILPFPDYFLHEDALAFTRNLGNYCLTTFCEVLFKHFIGMEVF
jgi:hypothetical protein